MENPNRADAANRGLAPNSVVERTGRQARAGAAPTERRLWDALPVPLPRHTPPDRYQSPRGVPLPGKPNRQCARATPRVTPVAGHTIAAPGLVGFGSPRSRHDLPSGRDVLSKLRSRYPDSYLLWCRPGEQLWLDDLGQEFQAIDQTWSGAAEIVSGVHGIDPPVTHRRQIGPAWQRLHVIQLAECLGDICAARHQDHHLRLVVAYGLPGDLRRWCAVIANPIDTPSDLHHLRHPMAGHE